MVVLAGVVNQGNYLDANGYANTGRGQFINSALVNSMVLPAAGVQLRPEPAVAAEQRLVRPARLLGRQCQRGRIAVDEFQLGSWSLEWEVGYMTGDFFGLGRGSIASSRSWPAPADPCRAA